jgi:SAM-dependent methyltransferase
MREAYLRYSFTKGTEAEIDALVGHLSLSPGMRILDVGCGPGRHSHELARRGMTVHGIDISAEFVQIAARNAPSGASFERSDARTMTWSGEFDAVICLCQGAFGVMRSDGEDLAVLEGIARALRPGGRLALTAFNAYFVVRHFGEADFDPGAGLCHERTEIRDPDGRVREVSLWTGCYTPRELRLLMDRVGLEVDWIGGAEPGRYERREPSVELPEHLVVASLPSFRRRDGSSSGGP